MEAIAASNAIRLDHLQWGLALVVQVIGTHAAGNGAKVMETIVAMAKGTVRVAMLRFKGTPIGFEVTPARIVVELAWKCQQTKVDQIWT